jgi:HAD superfamily hydrolase (TIGR01509 family)
MDGVLVASLDVHWQAYQRTFRAEGRDFSRDDYRRIAACASREVVITRVLGELPPAKLCALMQAKEDHAREILAREGVPAVPGAREFLRAVRARGFKTAVATTSRTPRLFLDAARLDHDFDAVVDRTQVARPKPHPDCYVEAARQLGVRPENCLAVEDTAVGIEAALAGGMRVFAIATTESAGALQAAGATAVFAGFDAIDLDAWLR